VTSQARLGAPSQKFPPSTPHRTDGAHRPTSPDPPGFELAKNSRGLNTGSSRMPSRLAHRARPIRQYCAGPTSSRLLPPSPPSRRSGCRQLHPTATTARRRRTLTSTRTSSASWRTPAVLAVQSGQHPQHQPGRMPQRLIPGKPWRDPINHHAERSPPPTRIYAMRRGHRGVLVVRHKQRILARWPRSPTQKRQSHPPLQHRRSRTTAVGLAGTRTRHRRSGAFPSTSASLSRCA
jgi:hypothetical protein